MMTLIPEVFWFHFSLRLFVNETKRENLAQSCENEKRLRASDAVWGGSEWNGSEKVSFRSGCTLS